MFIVDAHAHIGDCRVFDLFVTPAELINSMDQCGVHAAIVMPFPGARDVKRIHDEIAELGQKYPGRIFGMVNMNPHCPPENYFAEACRCIKQLGFVGLKLHTIGHAVNPISQDARVVFQTARELSVPVMVHTGPGIPFALPTLLLPIAKEFFDVKIVVAHAGFILFTSEAYILANECRNVYLETSWLFPDDIRWLVSAVSAKRVMMGSDLPRNLQPTLQIIESANLTEDEKRWILGQTAIEVFGLKVKEV